jgi:ParB/RepB/Spo0J family partition protein
MKTALAVVPRETSSLERIPLELIDVGDNVRVHLEGVDELATSITELGVLSPVKVVAMASGRYRLVWGQRRVLAARQAGLSEIPAIVELEDDELAGPGSRRSIEQLIENVVRADLNPIDRAKAMREVVKAGMSQADLARTLGLHPSTVANDVGLLEAPAKIQALVESGALTPSHAKAMKGLAPSTQAELAKEIVQRGYSAHRTEEEVQEHKRRAEAEARAREQQAEARKAKDAQLAASIADFEKKKVAKDALIIVSSGYSYGGDGGHAALVRLITAAGYTNVREAKSWNEIEARPGGVCDCTAWKASEHVTYDYSSGRGLNRHRVAITKGCTDRKHRQTKEQLADEKRRDAVMLQEKVQGYVKRMASGWGIPNARAIAIDRILGEAALFSLLSYRLPEWSEKHGGKRNTSWQTIHGLPDDELAKELATAIAGDFRDKAGYHVDWTGLATELGIDGQAPTAGDYPEEGAVPTAVQNAWNEAHS